MLVPNQEIKVGIIVAGTIVKGVYWRTETETYLPARRESRIVNLEEALSLRKFRGLTISIQNATMLTIMIMSMTTTMLAL